MATENVYAQAPLVIEQREIRILSLAPGIGDSVLHGDLIVESLNYDDLHYTALSYTWSGPVSQCSIIIGGVPLHITENLELALRRIRGLDRPKNLWVDAICINQNDNEEKSVQVLLMGDIYANAARTIVWLGEQSADSDVAMDFIHRGPHQLDIYRDEYSSDEGSSDEEDSSEDEYDGEINDTDSDDNSSNKDDDCADDSDKDDVNKDDVNKDDVDKDDVDKDDGDGLAEFDPGVPEVSGDENSDEEDLGYGDSSDESSSDESSSDEDDGNGDSSDQNSSDEDKSDADQITLQAVTDLMQRRWWTRIWVVQEALKSRRATVVCGAKEVDVAYFAQLFKVNKGKRLKKGFQMVSQTH